MFREEWLFRNMNQVKGIENYGTETWMLKMSGQRGDTG